MTIDTGKKLGRYEIRSQLGAGGMGEVYLARDTKLNRDVAIKVLPEALSGNSDRLRRFEQEAQAASALNHPNILIVYDVGAHDGTTYVVSELLEGETLRQRLGGTALGQRRAIDYGLQIAHGIAAAHEKGIVHRDLKPDNIFVTKDGRVKILDFGVAKLTQPEASQSQTEIPTRRVNTDPGVVIGTVGYMSPEQVRGKDVDHRSDIFSLGAILYEMLSGRRAFHGESAADTMSAILKEDPPELSETNKTISPTLERLVNHCLEKNPESRFHSASDLAFALEALSGSTSVSNETGTSLALPPTRWRMWEWLPWTVAAAALLLASFAFVFLYFRRQSAAEAPESVRFLITLPEKVSIIGAPLISPDGRRLVYRLNTEDGKQFLWIRMLGSLDAQVLDGTDGALAAFWSPDSRSIGFFVGGKLKKVDLSGGPPQTLADAPANQTGAWSRDGVIIFSRGPTDGLYRVPVAGGTPARITEIDVSRKEFEHVSPYFLPDGRHFLYLARNAEPENSAIYVGSLDSKEKKRLLQVHSSMAYAPTGYLLFVRDTTLMAQAFDADRLELTGEAFRIAEHTVINPLNGRAFFSVSENGVLALRTGALTFNQLIWFDRSGKQLEAVTPTSNHIAPSLSPDQKRVAVSRTDPQSGATADIWLVDLAHGNAQTRFSFDQAYDGSPGWSPDGSRIAFFSTRDGRTGIYQKPSSGAGAEEELVPPGELKSGLDWSPDGQLILYSQLNAKSSGHDLFVLPLSGERKPEPFLQTDFNEIHGSFSPDGRWVAYASNDSGQFQVYIKSFPPSGGKWQASIDGGAQPSWSGDGRELYYFTPDRKLMAVDVHGESSTFKVGVPRKLFDMRVGGAGLGSFPAFGGWYYTPGRDGKRFLVAATPEALEQQQIIVVLNWTADLKR